MKRMMYRLRDAIQYLFWRPDPSSYTWGCYDPVLDECNLSCQGCSECPLAKYYKGESDLKPTPKQMLRHMRRAAWERRKWDRIIASLDLSDLREMMNPRKEDSSD